MQNVTKEHAELATTHKRDKGTAQNGKKGNKRKMRNLPRSKLVRSNINRFSNYNKRNKGKRCTIFGSHQQKSSETPKQEKWD